MGVFPCHLLRRWLLTVMAGVSYKILWDDEYLPGPFDWTIEELEGPMLLPDFVVSELWAVDDTVFVTVTNDGSADSEGTLGNGTDYHGWSINGSPEAGYTTGPALAMGASATFSLSGLTYENMGSGLFDVAFHADVDNDTEELYEDNNVAQIGIFIEGSEYIPTFTVYRGEEAVATGLTNLFYVDGGLESSMEYCYVVTQDLEDLSESGPSNVACATTEDAPLGDLCSDPILLTLPTLGEMGSSEGYSNDYSASDYMSGVDIVYAFSIPEDGTISGNIADNGDEWSAMFVMQGCPDGEFDLIAEGSAPSGGSFSYAEINAGDYFLVVSNWPTPDEFTYTFDLTFMAGPAPMVELLSPVGNMMVSTLTPDFLWEAFVEPYDVPVLSSGSAKGKDHFSENQSSGDPTVDVTMGYEFYLGTDADLADVLPIEVIGSRYTPIEELMENQMYYWAVTALDDEGGVTYSDTASFWTNSMMEAPAEFALLTPDAGEEYVTGSPVFTWMPSSDADLMDNIEYMLILGENWDELDTIPSIADTSFTPTWTLEDNSIYHWRVFAVDNSGLMTSNTGGYRDFSINAENDSPSDVDLITPDSVQVLSLTPDMYWTAAYDPDPNDHVSYEMQWWGEGVEFDSVLIDTNALDLPRSLLDNAQYHWQVITMDTHDGISHSEVKTFWTDLEPEAPQPFALLSPENDGTGLSGNPTFSWEVATDPDPFDYATYTLQIATDSNFVDIAFEVNTEAIVEFEMTESLPVDTEYWWRVIATDTDDLSTESGVFKITVGTVSIAESLALPTAFVMDQNFPNPFNPSTSIRYGLPEDSHVSLVIYDVRGNVVRTLESGTQTAGWYTLVWDGRSNDGRTISTGLYLARIGAGEYSQVIKMLYLK